MQRIVGRSGTSAGNVHSENLERRAAMLLPSLLECVAAFPQVDIQTEQQPIQLVRRVTLELGGRSPDALGEPPRPIWVPEDDPQLAETLVRVQRERELARVAALRRRHAGARQRVDAPVVQAGSSPSLNIGHFGRRMTWYLRYEASTRPDGFVAVQSMLAGNTRC